ncbi:AAA family ATPase [Streptomyces sp. NPDC001889]
MNGADTEALDGIARRRLVVVALDEGKDDGFREAIDGQVERITGWLADPALGPDRRFEVVRADPAPTTVMELRSFLMEVDLAAAGYRDAVVVYITGHGVRGQSPRHYLTLPETCPHRLLSTAFPTSELITPVLDSASEHVLVLVDSCHSGILRAELAQLLLDLSDERYGHGGAAVVTAGHHHERPLVGSFTRRITLALERMREEPAGYTASHLSFGEWEQLLHQVGLDDDGEEEDLVSAEWIMPHARRHRPSACLPNPAHVPSVSLVDEARRALGWTRAELDQYWVSRAAGAPATGNGLWYFTGRSALVGRVRRFLTAGEGTLIVTGTAGSGKSALLARLVTLSDPRFRADPRYRPVADAVPEELRLPIGSVTAAVLARGASATELTASLYTALTGSPPPPRPGTDPLDRVASAVHSLSGPGTGPVTVVVDGIDEAKEPDRIITDLLQPLAALRRAADGRPAVRLLLGIRSGLPAPDGSGPRTSAPSDEPSADLLDLLIRVTGAGTPLRTDGAGTAADIALYAEALLKAQYGTADDGADGFPGPGRRSHGLRLEELARALAETVAPSFLDARIAVEQLGAHCFLTELPDPEDPGWRASLSQGTEELLRRDLADTADGTGVPVRHLVTVLRSVALSRGAGLPWADIWPAAVAALSDTPVGRDTAGAWIHRLRESRLMGYLTMAEEDGRRVYRLTHERVAELLRDTPHLLESGTAPPAGGAPGPASATGAHARLATAFSSLLDSGRLPPHPYLRRHLVGHAAAGGVLNDRLVPPWFLPWETQGDVRGALGLLAEDTDGTAGLSAWARVEPWLADAPPVSRADSLALAAREPSGAVPAGSGGAHRLVPRRKEFAVRGNVLTAVDSEIHALVCFRPPGGPPLVAIGGADGVVRVRDLSAGRPYGVPVAGPRGSAVRALAVEDRGNGFPLLLVGCEDGAWRCDPRTGEVRELPPGVRDIRALAVVTGPGGTAWGPAVGTGDGLSFPGPPGRPRAGGPPEGAGDRGRGEPVRALSFLEVPGGRRLLAVARADRAEILDAGSLDPVATVREPAGRKIGALALCLGRDGQPLLATATAATAAAAGGVRVWDASSGEERPFAAIPRPAVVLVRYDRPGRGDLLALGCADGAVQLWNPETGEEVRRFPVGHTGRVTALAVVPGDGPGPALVSGALDRSVRIWNPRAAAGDPEPAVVRTRLVPLSRTWGPHALLALGPGNELATWPPGPGGGARVEARAEVTAFAAHTGPGGEWTAAVGHPDGTVRLWRPGDGWRETDIWCAPFHATAFAVLDDGSGHPVLAVGTSGGSVAYCDPRDGAGWGRPGPRGGGPVHALVSLPPATGHLLAVASDDGVRLCHPRRALCAPLPDGPGAVRSLAVLPGDGPGGATRLVTGGADGRIRLRPLDGPGTERAPLVLAGHDGPVSALAVLPPRPGTGRPPLIVSAGSRDTTVRVWDTAAHTEVARLVTGVGVHGLSVFAAEDGRSAGDAPADPVIVFSGPAGAAAVTLAGGDRRTADAPAVRLH